MTRAMTRLMFSSAVLSLTAAVAMGQPTTVSKSATKGASTATSRTLSGTVVQVEGNTLAVRMTSGEIRMFTPPADRRFIIDGKPITLSELKPGTRLTAVVTETTTPVTDRTVQSLTGRVWYAAGPTVILTLANGENKMYTIAADSPVKFVGSDGKEMTVFDLRKDMNVSAVKITEAQRTELSTSTDVTGTAAPASTSTTAPTTGSTAGSGASAATSGASSSGAARTLPKTATQLPLLGLTGLASVLAGLGLTIRRRRS